MEGNSEWVQVRPRCISYGVWQCSLQPWKQPGWVQCFTPPFSPLMGTGWMLSSHRIQNTLIKDTHIFHSGFLPYISFIYADCHACSQNKRINNNNKKRRWHKSALKVQLVTSTRIQQIYKETEQKQQAITDSIKPERAPASGALRVILKSPSFSAQFSKDEAEHRKLIRLWGGFCKKEICNRTGLSSMEKEYM